MRMRSFLVLSVIALLFAASARAYGQGGTTSSIAGRVVDSTGGVVPGVTVTVKNNETGQVTVVLTNTAGTFSVPSLRPGPYAVTVALQGFKTAVYKEMRLAVGVP